MYRFPGLSQTLIQNCVVLSWLNIFYNVHLCRMYYKALLMKKLRKYINYNKKNIKTQS